MSKLTPAIFTVALKKLTTSILSNKQSAIIFMLISLKVNRRLNSKLLFCSVKYLLAILCHSS